MSDFIIKAPYGATKNKKRVGRGQGSGLGTTSGSGNNGQKARSGGSGGPYLGFEGGQVPLYRRLATRGFTNSRFKLVYQSINLMLIEKSYENGETVNLETLIQKGIIRPCEKMVKILGKGKLTKKLEVAGLKISASAKEMVEKAGGKVS